MTQTAQIWNEFHDSLFGFVKKRVHDKDLANDIVQDVFEKVHVKLPTLKDEDKIHNWIYQITRNRITDYYRSVHATVPIKDFAFEDENDQDQELFTAAECCLKRLIGELPDESRSAIEKTYFGNLSQKEIAAEEGISYTAFKSRVQRARNILQEWITDCCKNSLCQHDTSNGEKKCGC